MTLHWLLRAKRWAANPPGWRKVRFVLAIVAACVLLYAVDRVWGWPDWLTPNDVGRRTR